MNRRGKDQRPLQSMKELNQDKGWEMIHCSRRRKIDIGGRECSILQKWMSVTHEILFGSKMSRGVLVHENVTRTNAKNEEAIPTAQKKDKHQDQDTTPTARNEYRRQDQDATPTAQNTYRCQDGDVLPKKEDCCTKD